MEENDALSWDTPTTPHEYDDVVVIEKAVVLVRHHYAETGNVEAIFNEYLDDKMSEK